jgi:hypothetical protein
MNPQIKSAGSSFVNGALYTEENSKACLNRQRTG